MSEASKTLSDDNAVVVTCDTREFSDATVVHRKWENIPLEDSAAFISYLDGLARSIVDPSGCPEGTYKILRNVYVNDDGEREIHQYLAKDLRTTGDYGDPAGGNPTGWRIFNGAAFHSGSALVILELRDVDPLNTRDIAEAMPVSPDSFTNSIWTITDGLLDGTWNNRRTYYSFEESGVGNVKWVLSRHNNDDFWLAYLTAPSSPTFSFYKLNATDTSKEDFLQNYYFDPDLNWYYRAGDSGNYTKLNGETADGVLPDTATNLVTETPNRVNRISSDYSDERDDWFITALISYTQNDDLYVSYHAESGTLVSELTLNGVLEAEKDSTLKRIFFDAFGNYYEEDPDSLGDCLKLNGDSGFGASGDLLESVVPVEDGVDAGLFTRMDDVDGKVSFGRFGGCYWSTSSAEWRLQTTWGESTNPAANTYPPRTGWADVSGHTIALSHSQPIISDVGAVGTVIPLDAVRVIDGATGRKVEVSPAYNARTNDWSLRIRTRYRQDESYDGGSGGAPMVEFGEPLDVVRIVEDVTSPDLPNGGNPDIGDYQTVVLQDLSDSDLTLTGRSIEITHYGNFDVTDGMYHYRKTEFERNAPLTEELVVTVTGAAEVFYHDRVTLKLSDLSVGPTIIAGDFYSFYSSKIYDYDEDGHEILSVSGASPNIFAVVDTPYKTDDPTVSGFPYFATPVTALEQFNILEAAQTADTSKTKLLGVFDHLHLAAGDEILIAGTTNYNGVKTVVELAPGYVIVEVAYVSDQSGTATVQADGWFYSGRKITIDRERKTYDIDVDIDATPPVVVEHSSDTWRTLTSDRFRKYFVRYPTQADLLAANITTIPEPASELGSSVREAVVTLGRYLFAVERVIETASARKIEIMDIPMINFIQKRETETWTTTP